MNLDITLEVVTGSLPKRTAVGPLRIESTCSAVSLDFSLRAILKRLFLATIKVPSALVASVRRLFWSVTERPAYSVKIAEE